MNSGVSLWQQIKSRAFFYIAISLCSGTLLWLIEAIDRTLALKHHFVQSKEAWLFPFYFIFTAIGGPFIGIFLTICAAIRIAIISVTSRKTAAIDLTDRSVNWPGQALSLLGLLPLLALIGYGFSGFINSLLSEVSFNAVDKNKVLNLIFSNSKSLILFILFGFVISFTIIDELVSRQIRSEQNTNTGTSLFTRMMQTGVMLASLLVLAISYFIDANYMITRRDLSFHLPLFFTSLIAALILMGSCYRWLLKKQSAIILSLLAVFIFSAGILLVNNFEANQNLKSLFWRRGVVAKRYLALTRMISNREAQEFSDLLNSGNNRADDRSKETALKLASFQTSLQSNRDQIENQTTGTGLSDQKSARRNVIFLSVDTLRADHLGIYGYQRKTSTNLDQFARQSIFCERAYSTGTNTGHSFASILRSALGDGIFDNDVPTVPEVLADEGYQTALITSPKTNAWLNKRRWLEYKQILMGNFQEVVHESPEFWGAAEMTDRSIDLLKRLNAKGEFFAWIHYTDPHGPYEKHDEFNFGNSELDIYDSEIAYTDKHIGRLLKFLRETGLMENTMIVFTSDHGEGFMEHGETEHGCLPYIEQNFVPLWVYLPGGTGQRLSMPLSHIDLAPTMIGFTGEALPVEYEGRDIAKIARGEVAAHKYVISETPRNIPEGTFFAWALTQGEWKLFYDRVGNNWQLYNLNSDPLEQHNLVDRETSKFQELRTELIDYLNRQAARKNYSHWRSLFYQRSLGKIETE